MSDGDVICEIRWTVADVRSAFRERHGREPSCGELERCVTAVDAGALEERSIEAGWTLIDEAVEDVE